MNKSKQPFWQIIIVISFLGFISIETIASTVFSDSTFNLSNYTIDTYQTGGVSINTFQTASGGNPGAAVQSIINKTSSASFFSTIQVFMNNSFIYDPATQGAIQSIDIVGDTYVNLQNVPLGNRFATVVLSQGGNYYAHVDFQQPINAVWLTDSTTGLQANDFDLVIDPLSATFDTTKHPDFSKGIIQFGFAMSAFNGGGTARPVYDLRADNITYTINTAEPELVDISGTIKALGGDEICAMVLASGKYTFSCDPLGVFSLPDLPYEINGTVKRQVYADGFFPKIHTLPGSTDIPVVLTRSGSCTSYNASYDPGFVPGSAGNQIYIAGKVVVQDNQTPICAMVLANGQYTFSCDGTGSYALKIPLDTNGQYKLQVYADGFAPTIQTFDEYKTTNNVRMARAAECTGTPLSLPDDFISFFDKYSYSAVEEKKAIALALDINGRGAWGYSYNYSTQDQANEAALSVCRDGIPTYQVNADCRLYAIGEYVVW